MSLSCQEIVELVTDYLDGALDAPTTAAVREHLALCDGCETYVDQMRETATALSGIDVDALPGEMQDRLLAAFRAYPPEA